MSYNDDLERTLAREHNEAIRDMARAAVIAVIWLAILVTLVLRSAHVSWTDVVNSTGDYSATN